MKTHGTTRAALRRRILPAVGALAALSAAAAVLPASAQLAGGQPAAEDDRLTLRPGSKLWLEGDSNLHEWSCTANQVRAEIDVDAERGGEAPRPSGVESVAVTIPVAQIGCGNGKMESNLRKALKADVHPNIEFRLTRTLSFELVEEGVFVVVVEGELSVAGAARTVQLQVTGSDSGDGGLRIQGRQALLMTEFGVEPPTALLGMLKTDDEFVVLFDLVTDFAELAQHLSADRLARLTTQSGF